MNLWSCSPGWGWEARNPSTYVTCGIDHSALQGINAFNWQEHPSKIQEPKSLEMAGISCRFEMLNTLALQLVWQAWGFETCRGCRLLGEDSPASKSHAVLRLPCLAGLHNHTGHKVTDLHRFFFSGDDHTDGGNKNQNMCNIWFYTFNK